MLENDEDRLYRSVKSDKVLHRAKEEGNILQATKRRKVNWIGHILRRNCLLKHVFEGNIEGRKEIAGKKGEEVISYWMTLRKDRKLYIERGSTRLHCAENCLWKRLWTGRKTDYELN